VTTPHERTRALLQARDLLEELAYGRRPVTRQDLRERAITLLRHFPDPGHVALSALALPSIWGDPDTR
jgi:hypothetical protein